MEWMRSLTVALVALILGAGVLPAVAESGPSPDPSGSPEPIRQRSEPPQRKSEPHCLRDAEPAGLPRLQLSGAGTS